MLQKPQRDKFILFDSANLSFHVLRQVRSVENSLEQDLFPCIIYKHQGAFASCLIAGAGLNITEKLFSCNLYSLALANWETDYAVIGFTWDHSVMLRFALNTYSHLVFSSFAQTGKKLYIFHKKRKTS